MTTTPFAVLLALVLGCPQEFAPAAPDWRPAQELRVASSGGATLTIQPDKTVLATGTKPETDTYTLEATTDLTKITGFRIDVLPHESLGSKGPGRADNGNFVLSEVRIAAGGKLGGATRAQTIESGSASWSQSGHPIFLAIDGDPKTGWAIHPRPGQEHSVAFELRHPIEYRNGARLVITLDFQHGNRHTIGHFRLSLTGSPPPLLVEVPRPEDKELQPKINSAIDKGIEYLLAEQERDGSWAAMQDRYRNGQTALTVYTLVKSGVSPEHPAIRRALAFLEAVDPGETYSMGCQLMALMAIANPDHKSWVRRLHGILVGWQHPNGGWPYPWGGVDLSNTQYAALGLRAAASLGVPTEPDIWIKLGDNVIAHQEKPADPYAPAGYGYHPGREPTGSMTAAGVSVLAICREQLGESHPATARMVTSLKRGEDWLVRFFSAKDNPKGPNDEWTTYYLYGLERVAALLDLERLGAHDWYREGARFLTEKQKGEGSWSATGGRDQENTAFSLLFLSRATAPTTGKSISRSTKTYAIEGPDEIVGLRASGDTPLTVWITGLGDRIRERLGITDPKAPLDIRHADYVGPRIDLLTGKDGNPPLWQIADKEPRAEWTGMDDPGGRWSEGRGGFGPMQGSGATVRTLWEGQELWLRLPFEIDPATLLEPDLEIYWSSDAGSGVRNLAGPPLVELFDEDPDFAKVLVHQDQGSAAAVRLEGANDGEACFEVGPRQRHNPSIPGWFFPITKKPEEGEYRFLRFAWKKPGPDGVMIQLAFDGSWNQPIRYVAGKNTVGWEAIEVAKKNPEEWTVVTRDLIKDLNGREGNLTGVALTPMSNASGFFDGFYLARSLRDLKDIERRDEAPRGGRSRRKDGEAVETFSLYLNGELLHEDLLPTVGYEALLLEDGWTRRLRPGRNVFAVHCRRLDELRTFDLRLTDYALLASVDRRGPSDQRLAAQLEFPRPGEYEIRARVTVPMSPESEDLETLESKPLKVTIEKAQDAELLSYASDPARNLVAGQAVTVQASSEMNGWPAAHVADNLQRKGWLCADGDPQPTLSLLLERPVKANRILLSPTLAEKADKERTARIERVMIRLNGKGDPIPLDFPSDPIRKAVLELDRSQTIRRIDVTIVGMRPSKNPSKSAVGLSEIELQLER
ncbi:MAG: terpene cyclase/mutase family protein [Planctomycetota bacterium]